MLICVTIKGTYHKFLKISPSKYKPPKFVKQKTLKYTVKQSKKGKFPSDYKASPINFGTQISLHR